MIYYAAPLHSPIDLEKNKCNVQILRKMGFTIYLPQEHGVWEDLLKRFHGNEIMTRKFCYKNDLIAMQNSSMCIAHVSDRPPSEGMLWEMGYMAGCNKPVLLVNDKGWKYNLMPEYGSTVFNSWGALYHWLDDEIPLSARK